MTDWPLVSICIPIYRAGGFVDNIIENIETIDYPNLEFLLADQHGLDDAAEVLRANFADDERVRVWQNTDGRPWPENYNFLLQRATGRYVRWLSQDDRISGGLAAAVDCLEQNPEAVIAYGIVERIDPHGEPVLLGRSDRRRTPGLQPNTLGRQLLTLSAWNHSGGLQVLTRRRSAVDNSIEIRTTIGSHFSASRAWLYGMTLQGPFCFVPSYVTQKRTHPESVSATARRTLPRDYLAYVRAARSYAPARWTIPLMYLFGVVVHAGVRTAYSATPRGRLTRRGRT